MINNTRICKVCHCGDTQDNPLCYPCKCKGSIKYIHKECLFLFIDSSNKTFCTICKHKYVLKDVFRPDTPERVPLKFVLKGLFRLFTTYTYKLASNLLALFILLFMVIVNGCLMLHSSGRSFNEFMTPLGAFTVILFGLITTFCSYSNFQFLSSFLFHLQHMETRRMIRIDPLSAMNSIATDLLTESEIDGTARTLLTSITQSMRLRDDVDGRLEQTSINNNHSTVPNLTSLYDDISTTASSDETTFSQSFESSSFIPIGFSSLLKGVNISLLWWAVSLISSRINLKLAGIFSFLSDVYLDTITQKFLILYLIVLSVVGSIKCLRTVFKSSTFRILYSLVKIYHLIVLGLLHFAYFQGVCVHYTFASIVNNHQSVLSLESSYFRDYKTLFSLLFHLILGHSVSFIAKKTLNLFKNKFREGVLYFIVDSTANDLSILHHRALENVFNSIFSSIIQGFMTFLVSKYIFYILKGAIMNCYSSVCITSVNKALLLFKLVDLVSEPFAVFHNEIAILINWIIRVFAKILDLSNYLYGDMVKVDKTDLSRFRWLPNTHKYYRPTSVKKRYYKKVSSEDVEERFCDFKGNRNDNDDNITTNNYLMNTNTTSYSLYYVPPYFRFKCLLILFISLSTYVSFYFLLFRLANYFGSFFQSERFFDNSSDVMLIVTSGIILQGLRCVFYLLECLKGNKSLRADFISFIKRLILLAFSLIIWPLWSTFIILVLYSEPLRSIYPGRLISLLFSSSSIISFILTRIIFLRPITEYSFSIIFKKLYGFISVMTFLIICISLLRSYSFLVIIETSEIPFLLIFGISALLFYLKHCIKYMYTAFLDNIKKEHYLIDRNVENYTKEKGE